MVKNVRKYLLIIGFCLSAMLHVHYAKGHTTQSNAYFIPNGGQWPEEVKAMYQLQSSRIFITTFGLRIVCQDQQAMKRAHDNRNYDERIGNFVFDMHLRAATLTKMEVREPLGVKLNFIRGQNSARWATDLRPANNLYFKEVYPGIDLEFKQLGGNLKYEFIVHPGADAALIQWELKGLSPELLKSGELRYATPFGTITEQKPFVYQVDQQKQEKISAKFKVVKQTIQFSLGRYNKAIPLIIDPMLVFATFSGSSVDNWGFTATSDRLGNGYLGGIASGMGYPTTIGSFDDSYNLGQWDMAISKFSSNGQLLLYSTFIGGAQDEYPMSMVTDSLQQLVILGKTRSNDFPVSASAFDNQYNGQFDMVVTKLNATGSALIGSTYIGGSANDGHNRIAGRSFYQADSSALEYNYGDDSRGEVILDEAFNVYVASNTASTDFPTVTPLIPNNRGLQDGVVFKLNANLSSLIYSTYVGGSADDAAYGIAVIEPNRQVVVVGGTRSSDFLTAPNGYDLTFNGVTDGWIIRLGASGNSIAARTYIGTSSSDQAFLVQLDDQNRVYVMGQSRGNMPVSPATVYNNQGSKHFIQRYSSNLATLEFSTTIGPVNGTSPSLSPTALLVDLCNRVYVAGWGGSVNGINPSLGSWPVTPNAFQSTTDGSDFYFMVLDSNVSSLLYSSYFGGSVSEHVDGGTSRFNPQGVIYQSVCAGCGGNSSFPVTQGAYSVTNNSLNCNAALFKFDMEMFRPVAGFVTQYPDTPVCQLVPVVFQSTGTANANYFWDFGVAGATSTLPNPSYTYSTTGIFTVTLIVSNCVGSDTIRRNVNVIAPASLDVSAVPSLCPGDTIAVFVSGGSTYRWQPHPGLLDTVGNAPRFTSSTSSWLYVWVANSVGCELLDSVLVIVTPQRILLPDTMEACLGGGVFVQPLIGAEVVSFSWDPHPAITNLSQPNQQLNPTSSAVFYFITIDSFGCSQRDSVWIAVLPKVFANAGPNRYICSNDSFTLTASGGQRYLWNTGDTSRVLSLPPQAAGTFWLIAYIDSCRSLADTVVIRRNEIEANFVFSPDTGYAPAKISFINRSTGDGLTNFIWDFGDGSQSRDFSPVHVYRYPGEFTVSLIAANSQTGCADSMDFNYVFIDSVAIFIPNAFTPNGDGVNDFFTVTDRNFETFTIWIYNRWGQLVFQSNDPDFNWDGKLNGENLASGSYPFLIQGVGKNAKPINYDGEIRLIR